MMCAWKSLLGILPQWLRPEVDAIGYREMEELRLRINAPPEIRKSRGSLFLKRNVCREDLHFVINQASHFSPWASDSVSQGYLTAPGGHRIGICGEAVCKNGVISGIREVSSLCIRVAKDYAGIGTSVREAKGSVLVLGAPGWGKTTLLRDMIRILSETDTVAVVDQRGELFPEGFLRGKRTDILTGTGKAEGIEMVLRAMGPRWIAVDEITAKGDCDALIRGLYCGVRLIATAHAASVEDFRNRSVYRPLLESNVFQTVFLLRPDKTYTMERTCL